MGKEGKLSCYLVLGVNDARENLPVDRLGSAREHRLHVHVRLCAGLEELHSVYARQALALLG